MTNQYPPYQGPKKLERSRDNKVLGGVCAGIANYLNMDPTLVRLLVVTITVITGGAPLLLYVLALFLMSEESPRPSGEIYPSAAPADYWSQGYPPAASGYPQSAPPPYAANRPNVPADPVWGPAGAPWEQAYPGTADPANPATPNPANPVSPDPKAADPTSDRPGDTHRG